MPHGVLAVERGAGDVLVGKTPFGEREEVIKGTQSWLPGPAASAVGGWERINQKEKKRERLKNNNNK